MPKDNIFLIVNRAQGPFYGGDIYNSQFEELYAGMFICM